MPTLAPMLLQSMLCQERLEHGQWTSSNLASPSDFQNPTWRPYLAQWYFSVIDSVEQFDGNHGTFCRSIAYTALKILDIYLSSCPIEFQQRANADQHCYKLLAIACLFIAIFRSNEIHQRDGLIVAGKVMPVSIFLRMCNSTQDISLDEFVFGLRSISSLLESCDHFKHDASPLVSAHFLVVLREYIFINFPHFMQDNEDFSVRAETLVNHTVASVHFSSNAPSLNAVAALVIALQDVDRDVITSILTCYRRNGGYDLSPLRDIVRELRTIDEHEIMLQEQRNENLVHVIPEYYD